MWGFLLVRQTEVVSDPKTVPGIVMDPKTVRSLFKIRLVAILLRLMGWTTLSVLIMHVNPVMSEQNVETRILTVFPHLDCPPPSVSRANADQVRPEPDAKKEVVSLSVSLH